MSSDFPPEIQGSCLQKSDDCAEQPVEHWSIEAGPTVEAWRVDSEVAAYRCPRCLGLHYANVPAHGPIMTTRTTACPDIFRRVDGAAINLAIQDGLAPDHWRHAYWQALPIGALADAARLIRDGSITNAARLKRLGDDLRNHHATEPAGVWAPSHENVTLALAILRRFNSDEARRLAREYAGQTKHSRSNGIGPDAFDTPEGVAFRAALLAALGQAWRDVAL